MPAETRPYPASMVLNDLPTSRKAYTETRNFAAVQAFHWRKDPLLMLWCNTDPVIANTDDPFLNKSTKASQLTAVTSGMKEMASST